MFRRLVMAGLAMAAVGSFSTAQAQKSDGDWVKIGTYKVDVSKDRDTIDLSKSSGKFRALRINSKDGDITLSRVQVLYANGAVHNEDRKIVLNDGERTRPINAGSEDRFVDQLNLSVVPSKGNALLEVYGLQTGDGAKAKRSAALDKNDKPVDKAVSNVAAQPTKAAPSAAVPGTVTEFGDVLFGSQYVGFGVDRDVIRVGSEIGKFDKIRLRVLDNEIHIKELKVVYANNETDDLVVNADIKQNSRTQWFGLKGDRFIKEVQLVYRSKPSFKGQARIEVLGQYAEGWLGPQGEGRKFNQGWVLLGAQTAGFVGFDKDVIPVGKNEGGFKKIRVTVKDRSITLNELRVIYSSGQEDVVPVKAKIEAGSTYGPIDLKGGTRTIKEIQARYRSRFIDKDARGKGMATVEVWGQH
ncbi:MAG: DUF2541 domain-containing protein [Hyphomicrobiaceae bacterium]